MNDSTILYYTANRIHDFFATNVRNHLLETAAGMPIVSVSQKPIDFGENICVGEIGASTYNVYRQVLTGAKRAKTKYVVCCEDDTLYSPGHLQYIPPEDTFTYDLNRWAVMPTFYFYRKLKAGMYMCVAPTELMVKTLEARFEKYPTRESTGPLGGMPEPGRRERIWGLPPVKAILFTSEGHPSLNFRHRVSLGGVRRLFASDIQKSELPVWGNATDLWKRFYG